MNAHYQQLTQVPRYQIEAGLALGESQSSIANRVPIIERPEAANNRDHVGDWEGDTVHSKSGNFVTLTDRKTRYLCAHPVQRCTRLEVTRAINLLLKPHVTHTFTLDNGKEFSGHEHIAQKSQCDVYFAEPYSSWQRRTNENINGLSGDVLTAWHHAEIYQKAREHQPIRSDFLPVHIYRKIQDKLLQIVCEKHIALEALPTSNVRISYYHSYAEHHIHRWLDDKATYRPVVVMGSDDPGIFSTNIFNEYAHVFMSMKDKRVHAHHAHHAHHAINKIRELVGHSQSYGFES